MTTTKRPCDWQFIIDYQQEYLEWAEKQLREAQETHARALKEHDAAVETVHRLAGKPPAGFPTTMAEALAFLDEPEEATGR